MDTLNALKLFETLAQESRLNAFRLLVKAGTTGISAGELSQQLGIPHNTLSFHLSHLSNAGAITSRKEGRKVIYQANYSAIHQLLAFIVADCCSQENTELQQDKKTGKTSIHFNACCSPQGN